MLRSLKKRVQNIAQSDAERVLLDCLSDIGLPPEPSEPTVEENITPANARSEEDGLEITYNVVSQIISWAGDDPKRWKCLHNALLKIYAPTWEHIDARDILVSWVGAYLGLTTFQQQLKRLAKIPQPLTHAEQVSKRAREADISFYGRLIARMENKVLQALSEDTEATRVIEKVILRETKGDSTDDEAEESSS